MANDPIEKSLTVPLPPDEAFDLFVNKMHLWWPKESHSVAARDDLGAEAQIRVEPGEGGQVIETHPDGTDYAWARITRWLPGQELGLKWHPGREEEEATDLLIVFSLSDQGTYVQLTHSGFGIYGDQESKVHAGYDTGWDHVLGDCFATACSQRMNVLVS